MPQYYSRFFVESCSAAWMDGLCYQCDLCFQINEFKKTQTVSARPMTVEEVAMGFIQVANEAMCRPIRALTQVVSTFITHK